MSRRPIRADPASDSKSSNLRREMNSRKTWEYLTQTASSTPMGKLLRRYWWPITGWTELVEKSVMEIRLLGEDLVLYRDLTGKPGLLEKRCAHRCADLAN